MLPAPQTKRGENFAGENSGPGERTRGADRDQRRPFPLGRGVCKRGRGLVSPAVYRQIRRGVHRRLRAGQPQGGEGPRRGGFHPVVVHF